MAKSKHEKVIMAVEDRFYDEGMFSSAKDIAAWTGISENKVRDLLEELTGTGLFKVYEGAGKPTIYVTKDMRNSLVSKVSEPEWISGEYEFPEKRKIQESIEEGQEKLSEYITLEKLLYAGGKALEPPVEKALEVLGFETESTEEDEDFIVEYKKKIYIIEVKGKAGQVKKRDVAQLGTWLDKWAEKEKAEKLRGLLLVNHYRNSPPEDRKEPLTEKAIEFLNLRPTFYKTTPYLFKLVKKVKENELSKGKAKKRLLEQ